MVALQTMTYKIICHGPKGNVIADLSLDGILTVHHDHMSKTDDINLGVIVDALDRWAIRREICHRTKRGLKENLVEQVNQIQQLKPGKTLFGDEFQSCAKLGTNNE